MEVSKRYAATKKSKSTASGFEHIDVANHLDRKFNVDASNKLWVSDFTYIHTHKGFLFLAVVIDLFVRGNFDRSMASRMTEDIVMKALSMAYWRRRPEKTLMIHSEQVSQYTSNNWGKQLKDFYTKPSKSRRRNCHDKAVAEKFLANLKKREDTAKVICIQR